MRTDTKLAIVVAVVFIVLGAWYIMGGTKTASSPTAKDTPETPAASDTAESPAPPAAPRLAQKDRQEPRVPATDRPAGRDRPQRAPRTTTAKPVDVEPAVTDAARPEPAMELPAVELPAGPAIAPTPLSRTDDVGLADGPALPDVSDSDEPETEAVGAQREVTAAPPAPDATAQPARDSSRETAKAAHAFTEHTIQPGDTYTSLAVKYLGHARYADKIAEANPTLEPRRLRLGAIVKIPVPEKRPAAATATQPAASPVAVAASPAPAAQATPVPAERSYEVKPGEGWYTLAERFLGSGTRWTELYELNKGRVPTNFNILPAGTTIELPPGATRTAQ